MFLWARWSEEDSRAAFFTSRESLVCSGFVTVVSNFHYQSTLDAAYVCVLPWSEFSIIPSYPQYPRVVSRAAFFASRESLVWRES